MNYNKVILVGRLVADPEIRSTPSGQSVCNIRLATNRVWTDQQGNKQEAVEYHDVVLWQKLADTASRFLTKGSLALIEGRLQTRSWQDQTGSKRYRTEIVAENLQLGPRPFSKNGQQGSEPKEQNKLSQEPEEEIDIRDIPL